METKDKRLYERPAMTVVELQHRAAVLVQTSGNTQMNVVYYEEDI
jgi:hypothetical protein